MNPLPEFIEALGLTSAWTFFAVFVLASLLMLWRLEALLKHADVTDAELAGLEAEAFVTEILRDGLGLRHLVAGADFRFGKGRRGDVEMLRAQAQAIDTAPKVSMMSPETPRHSLLASFE